MNRVSGSIFTVTASVLLVANLPAQQMEASRGVADGGIKVAGWMGKIDASRENTGLTINDARFAYEGDALRITTGPSATYWNTANTATGQYTVKATFKEPKYMSLNSHPHPYGIVVAGSELGTDRQSFLYCAAYGTGYFIVRGFGPDPFRMNGPRGELHDAVNKAAGTGSPITQEIAVSVRADKVECAINGTVVASYPRADVVAAGKLKSTDGVYGVRFGHNTEVFVTGLSLTKH
jgi:hypothetical protein